MVRSLLDKKMKIQVVVIFLVHVWTVKSKNLVFLLKTVDSMEILFLAQSNATNCYWKCYPLSSSTTSNPLQNGSGESNTVRQNVIKCNPTSLPGVQYYENNINDSEFKSTSTIPIPSK